MIIEIISLAVAISVVFTLLSRRFERTVEGMAIPDSGKRPLVSILIPTYNSEKTITKTLNAVGKSDYPNKEIMVINDSDDRTPDIARQYGARVIQNTDRRGKGHALNTGSKQARGELLLFLDSDTEPEPDALSKLVSSYYHHRASDPMTAMVVPGYVASNQHKLSAKLSHLEQQAHQAWIKAQMNLGSILSIRGSCMLIGRHAFERTGGFSQTVLEDGDFSARMHRLGYHIKYEPRARVGIAEPETFREFFRAKKRYGKGTFFCALRHKDVYLASKHAILSFYPGFLLIALSLIFLITTPVPALSFILFALAVSGLGAANIKFAERQLLSSERHMKAVSLALMPIVILAYLIGVASGARDKLTGSDELRFKDW